MLWLCYEACCYTRHQLYTIVLNCVRRLVVAIEHCYTRCRRKKIRLINMWDVRDVKPTKHIALTVSVHYNARAYRGMSSVYLTGL